MKKMTTFVCVAAITASLLAGCGSKTAETTAASTEAAAATEAASTEAAVEGTDADKEAAKKVADLIDAIYVQERNDNTDEQCKEAKAAWDALTDAQKELVEGENADPDYFGRDTGDASKDDPRKEKYPLPQRLKVRMKKTTRQETLHWTIQEIRMRSEIKSFW